MNSLANPVDLLLSYDENFIGFTSLSNMSQPVESSEEVSTEILGGNDDLDEYDDFTSQLNRFVKEYPMLNNIDLNAMVIQFDFKQKDDTSDDDTSDDDTSDDDNQSNDIKNFTIDTDNKSFNGGNIDDDNSLFHYVSPAFEQESILGFINDNN